MFVINMLPGGYGDCLWIEYGDADKPHRVLIDAGTLPTYKDLRKYIEGRVSKSERRLELFLITHIDTDHIDTAVRLLNSPSLGLNFEQIWFNGWNQLVDADKLGPQQGEYVSALVSENKIPLNPCFKGKAIFTPSKGRLPSVTLPGGMKLTVLSPGKDQLIKLRSDWKKMMGKSAGNAKTALKKLATQKKYKDSLGPSKAVDLQKLADSETKTDSSPANGSSIAVLAEYEGKRCLFGGDCHPDVLESSIQRLLNSTGSIRLALSAFKVPHHGSKYNNPSTLFKKLNCKKYLISTNGKIFRHPDAEAIARIILYGGPNAELYFNYDTTFTQRWDDDELQRPYKYKTIIRPNSDAALEISL